ncbi:MAG: hypothetical protein AB7E51_06705 [Pseudodesulfovibrio sp.]|uniref:hypothetical protein n=1 Tax=Pseudodesulfovibrio sp. TaxID=2035812 RepID=UPI003D0CC5A5
MSDRKKELKKWFIDHPMVTVQTIAAAYGKSPATVNGHLYHCPSAPADLLKICEGQGIPGELLPPVTRSKAELMAENEALRERLAEYEDGMAVA